MPKASPPKTLDEFLNSLNERDMTVAAWARENGFPPVAVWAVVNGQLSGRHGRARQIVRAMGIEPPPMRRVAPAKAERASV